MTALTREEVIRQTSRPRARCGVAAALTTFERPVGKTENYIVECECGWRSQRTTDWRRSLDDHFARESKRRGTPSEDTG